MADIKSLLNPILDHPMNRKHSSTGLTSEPRTRQLSPPPTPRKKPKLCKDAAVFIPGEVRGKMNYPPFEDRDDFLQAQHQQHELYPMGHIADYPRHIPYNSEKKTFLEKTGRESFEVFQYEFKVPGDDKVYCMMWDYNIGLVRTTALFKCTGYSKTTPAKMLNRNPGLREVCHSITGGALVAQGYWMPYEAARAVATTFCWRIRYALTPIFGLDFPSMCIPTDSDNFGEMVIDPTITRLCSQNAKMYKALEDRLSRDSSVLRTPATPDSSSFSRFGQTMLSIDTKNVHCTSDHDRESSTDRSYALSSLPTYSGVWTPANTPRSGSRVGHHSGHPSPKDNVIEGTDATSAQLERTDSKGTSPARSSSCMTQTDGEEKLATMDSGSNGSRMSSTSTNEGTEINGDQSNRRHGIIVTSADENAAYSLMSMRMAVTDLNDNVRCKEGWEGIRGRKRRASA